MIVSSLESRIIRIATLTQCLAVGSLVAVDASKIPPAASRFVDYAKEVQPIFAQHCYSCHGLEKQKSELRWDDKAAALKGGEHGPVIVPGRSAESRVIQLVAGLDPDAIMPPKGEPLTPDQIGLLRAWIDQGAIWPETGDSAEARKRNHWAFRPPVPPAVPLVKNKRWARNPIDAFILARLETEKLKPAPEADRVTLIRRLSLDLIGLPPTLTEVDEFLADKRPDAYERLVDRLLASPHYGERWGRHWLDAARYADTNGYEKDSPRSIWPYRDWVIAAFNRDLPFDQFIIEQIAGDLLPQPTREQVVATGFLRNAMSNQEGGIDPEQFRVEALVDRMDTLGKAVLGLTVACAQCHNHKFDPISQKEYYQLYAFLNNDDEAFLEVPTPDETGKREEVLSKVRRLELAAMKSDTNLTGRMAAWEKEVAGAPGDWTVLEPLDWFNFATKFEKQADGSLLGGGDVQPGGVMKVWADTTLTNITGLRLEALTNPNLPYGGPGQRGQGSFLVKEFTVEAYPQTNATVTNTIRFSRALASAAAPGFAAANAIDGNTTNGGWSPSLTPDIRNQDHQAVFECNEPFGFAEGTRVLITMHQTFNDGDDGVEKGHRLDCHMLGCFRLSATTNTGPLTADPLLPAQRALLATPSGGRTMEQQRELFSAFRRGDSPSSNLNQEIEHVFTNWPSPATTLVLQQRAAPRVTRVFKRGDRLRPGDAVRAGVPAVLNPWPEGAPANRLGLARWLVDPLNPTVARTAVNRVWMEYFGQGLVTTPEDFGTRVEPPSHPELLDWLACEFVSPSASVASLNRSNVGPEIASTTQRNDGSTPWSLKHLHRLIANSATYRQSSRVSPEALARDPFNHLLARAPRWRLQGEVVQDVALAASGLLNPKVGGPSVYPPIPANVGDTSFGGFQWPETKGEDRYRRALYTFWKRSLPFPSLAAFDVPSGEVSCPRRNRSNTPLQALTTLNERTFVEAAQAMGLRVLKEGGKDDRTRITYAFRLATGRAPTASELGKVLKFCSGQREYFEDRTSAALLVAVTNPTNVPPDVNIHRVAAWAMVARTILNLDETVTRE